MLSFWNIVIIISSSSSQVKSAEYTQPSKVTV